MSTRAGARSCRTRRTALLPAALAAALLTVAAGSALVAMGSTAPQERVIAAYTTSFENRSAGQIENALLAARSLDGAIVRPGEVFSLNHRVGPWTADRGYRRAPVSYDGELILATGGGVCQLSTTLYGAALLAGMEIVERHRHFWPVNYARPGLDAAVAFPDIDLRFRNPLPAAVRVRARRSGERLVVEVLSTATGGRYSVEVEQLAVHAPVTMVLRDAKLEPGEVLRATRGQPGREVAVYRVHHLPDAEAERTLISRDSYPTLNRVMKVAAQ
ncbi:MAG: VanW family protein [Armatimonadota bacterium]